MKRNIRANKFNLLIILALSANFFACANLQQYGARYPNNDQELVIGVPPSAQMLSELNETRQARASLLGRPELAQRYARCMYFRNQLVVAAESSHGTWNPAANQVNRAAKDLERAYQKSDSDFLRICEEQLAMPLGKAFAEYWPEQIASLDANLNTNSNTKSGAEGEAEINPNESAAPDNSDQE